MYVYNDCYVMQKNNTCTPRMLLPKMYMKKSVNLAATVTIDFERESKCIIYHSLRN